MQIEKTPIEGLLVLKPKVFTDSRGYFVESYNQQAFKEAGITDFFVQDNQSKSQKNALRGLHFQAPPMAQGKLVRVITGAVLDVVVDIRKNSPTYGQNYTLELTEDNFLQLWIPAGFAHGFLVLKDETVFAYKCSDFYSHEHEMGLMWNDTDLNIDWGTDNPILSDKDKNHISFANFNTPF